MLSEVLSQSLQLWGGAECTVNRLGNEYRDQLKLTGHHDREQDLDLLAESGLDAMRYPVLWERTAPDAPDKFDWEWGDRRLGKLRQLGIRPIVGLIHHGSGPAYTSLVEDSFAPGLAKFAAAAARRYPWVNDWTPVNEPLTTARFSALYGHWYPHARDERLFWSALLNQIDAIRLSMRAIQAVNPEARLIQTEDLGRTYATAALAGQAGFENMRRWATWDLLCGKVLPEHPLWDEMARFGLQSRLQATSSDPCPPDIIGINHYLTSDRFLDHRVQSYPQRCLGGNGRQEYADTEAVRVLDPPPASWSRVIAETWDRYGLPMALTEVHNDCTREEQLRWFGEAWEAAVEARKHGVPVSAVTSWAMFGSSGWDTLLTGPGRYSPGAFDASSGTPRRTAGADLLSGKFTKTADHVNGPGWWQRNIRLHHPVARLPARIRTSAQSGGEPVQTCPIVITGATGTLGQAMAAACEHRGLPYELTGRAQLDLLDPVSVADALERYEPSMVIDCSGWVRVDEAEAEADACMAINASGAAVLAEACAKRGIPSAAFSSDLVFAGQKGLPYSERDRPEPCNVYGHSKARMEQALLELPGTPLVVRTAAFFSPFDHANFAHAVAAALSRGERFAASGENVVTPTYVPDLCNAVLDLMIDRASGLWQLTNGEAISWADFARRLASGCGYDPDLIEAISADAAEWTAPRPHAVPLASERGNLMPSLQSGIDRFCAVRTESAR